MSVFPDEFRKETKECLEKWRNIIINKHETEENFCGDPILIIEYNDAGLTARNIDSHAVAQVVRNTAGYVANPFPNNNTIAPLSDSVFVFNRTQILENAIKNLHDTYHDNTQAIVGRVFVLEFLHRNGTFETWERFRVKTTTTIEDDERRTPERQRRVENESSSSADEKETEPSLFSPSDDNDSDVRITREDDNNPFIEQTKGRFNEI
ncbi:unnamed protein product [Rhizophagus irregularis]|uniref:Uncharacterized protein n=1 Tax=Rhizophagus irregularis TaxID=588596 RepID=A0A2I1H4D0_9GLOM|nr:hypothetical protein RhiirA4_472098 [Rhizophagus irregularis]CAB4415202.1 unnamed protein product [Rhizophagus irregularis]